MGIVNGKFDRQIKPTLVHKDITKDSTAYERMAKQDEQKETIWDWDTQESVDYLLVDCIVDCVYPQYPEARNKDYMGFAGETTYTLIEYTRTAWCHVSTYNKTKARGVFREPWDQVSHITTYVREPGQAASSVEKVRCALEQ